MSTLMTPPETAPAGYVLRYTFRERLCHWVTALTYTYCLATGLAFYTPHLFWIALALGGGPTSRFWHSIVGLLFLVGAICMHGIWRRDMEISDADKRWLGQSRNYVTNREDLTPAADRFNGGQKLFYWLMFYGALVLLVSGIFIWFPEYISFKIAWVRALMMVIHEIAALVTIGGFIIHIYMGIFLVPGSMTAMTVGYVTKAWAKAHHRLWYERESGKAASKE